MSKDSAFLTEGSGKHLAGKNKTMEDTVKIFNVCIKPQIEMIHWQFYGLPGKSASQLSLSYPA